MVREDTPVIDAQVWLDLGRIYRRLAESGPGDERDRWREKATVALERSATVWRQATLPTALESRRSAALTAPMRSARRWRVPGRR